MAVWRWRRRSTAVFGNDARADPVGEAFECHGHGPTNPLQDDNEAVWYIAARTAAATAP